MKSPNFDYKSLAQQYGTPLLVLDKEAIRRQYRLFRECLPDVEVHYAIKCLNHPEMIKVLDEEGCGFDIATMSEVNLCNDA